MLKLDYSLVDVFARHPLSGNSLSVFLLDQPLPAPLMLAITRELRQFETIFLQRDVDAVHHRARIFTLDEELDFAGHPLIGAAAVLHARLWPQTEAVNLSIQTRHKRVALHSHQYQGQFQVSMDQGTALCSPPLPAAAWDGLLAATQLCRDDLAPGLPLQVVSTGLPYLIIPVRQGLERVRPTARDFEARLEAVGAKFAYVVDVNTLEARSWDNHGQVEDIATGSAAGPAAAYLVQHGCAPQDKPLRLHQGRFVHRPSDIEVSVGAGLQITVHGQVCPVGGGHLLLPKPAQVSTHQNQ